MRRLFAGLVAIVATSAHGAEDAARWYLQMDNDFFFATDRNYSSGLRLGRVAGTGTPQVEWGVLQEVYSPEGKYWTPGTDDRAPTARLLAYGARHRFTTGAFDTFEGAIGVRGPSALGEKVTDIAHRWADAAEVDWSRQEGDEIDVHLAATRSRALDPVHLHYGAVAGNQQAFVHGAVEWRHGQGAAAGAFSPLFRYVASPPPPAGEAPGWAVFAGAGLRAVIRNAMIERNYDAFGPELEPRRVVGRAAAGVAWAGAWGSLTFALALDTREFAAQREAHAFGSLTAHVRF